jgi:hypothetical protein
LSWQTTSTRSGATNKATNRLDPIATDTAKSILFLIATRTAVTYSAAPPTSGNRITPVNKYDVRNRLIADVFDDNGQEFIQFTNGKEILVEAASRWEWERVLKYASS